MADKEDIKYDDINWNEPMDHSYLSIKSIILKTIHSIEERNRTKLKTEVIETVIKYLAFCKDDLVVLGARSSIGKTGFILSLICDFIVNKNIPVGLITPGKIDCDIGMRLLAINSEVSLAKIRMGLFRDTEMEKIQKSAHELFNAPLYFYDEPNCSFRNLKQNVVKMVQDEHIQLLFIDGFEYIQEIIDSDAENYRTRLCRLFIEFKSLAVDLQIPIILSLDLPVAKSNREPTIRDLRKKLIIADKADKIIFLHRNCLCNFTKYQNAELILLKNTTGYNGNLPLHFYPNITKFTSV